MFAAAVNNRHHTCIGRSGLFHNCNDMKAILLLVAFLGLVASFSPHRLQTKAIRRSRQCVTQVKLASTDAPKPSKAPVKKWSKDTKSGSGSSGSDNRASVENFVTVPHDRWLQGSIQSVSNFGIFVRPAGSDAVGMSLYLHF